MDNSVFRVVLIEDNPADVRFARELLDNATGVRFHVEWRARLAAALDCLSRDSTDVILLDLSMKDGRGIETFLKVRAKAPCVPIVVLSSRDDETLAMKAVDEGAQDDLTKEIVIKVCGHREITMRAVHQATATDGHRPNEQVQDGGVRNWRHCAATDHDASPSAPRSS